ncbi:hypothetical protein J5491_02615 [Candidatus Saccharibacteria bacterium]|nr:hypothetical protein [Candidatus Saccharibacteria bacterium]
MQSIDEFIEQLLVDKGITNQDPEVKKELVEEMKTRLLDQIDRAAIMQLPDDKVDELTKKLDDPEFTNEKMTEFMQQSGVDLTQVTIDTMVRFRDYYLEPEE